MPLSENQRQILARFHADQRGLLAQRLSRCVGRAAELTTLQAEIAALRLAGGYLVITGRAGQGKSLMIASLIATEPAQPVYHCISFTPAPDYQTLLLRSLIAQLLLKHERFDAAITDESLAALRDLFAALLRDIAACGGQETIYIDGLDQLDEEADGWADLPFLPSDLPAGIVFVLGSRPTAVLQPLRRLQRRVEYMLPNLSCADFALLLARQRVALNPLELEIFYHEVDAHALYLDLAASELARAPAADRAALVKRLAGDPEQIFSLAIARLAAHPLWKPIIRPLMGVLLVTRQPLSSGALAALIAQPSSRVEQGLQRLGGLVAPDGVGHYALFHLKLYDYLRQGAAQPDTEAVFSAEQERGYHAVLANWCEQAPHGIAVIWQEAHDDDALEQERRSYARAHYITHLFRAQRWAALFRVIDAGSYGRAKIAHDPSMRTYAADLDLARRAVLLADATDLLSGSASAFGPNDVPMTSPALQTPASTTSLAATTPTPPVASSLPADSATLAALARLPRLRRYSMLRGELSSRADSYPSEIFEGLALLGRERQALGLAELLTSPASYSKMLATIGAALGRTPERVAEAERLLLRAYESIRQIPQTHERDQALSEVALRLGEFQQFAPAQIAARAIVAHDRQAEALAELAALMDRAGDHVQADALFADVLELARSVEDSSRELKLLDLKALRVLANPPYRERARQLDDRLATIAEHAPDLETCLSGIASLIERDLSRGETVQAQLRLRYTADLLVQQPREPLAGQRWGSSAVRLLQALAQLGDPAQIGELLISLFPSLRQGLQHPYDGLKLLQALCETAAKPGVAVHAPALVMQLLALVEGLSDIDARACLGVQLVDALTLLAQPVEALLAAWLEPLHAQRVRPSHDLIRILTRQGYIGEAVRLASPPISDWRNLLDSVIETLLKQGKENQAYAIARAHGGKDPRWVHPETRSAQILALADAGRSDEALRLLPSLPEFARTRTRATLMVQLARSGERERAMPLLDEALRPFPRERAQQDLARKVLYIARDLAYRKQGSMAIGVLGQAMEQTRQLADPDDRCPLLIAIADQLLNLGEREAASQVLDEALSVFSSHTGHEQALLINVLLGLGRIDDALALAAKIALQEPNDGALEHVISYHLHQGAFEAALALIWRLESSATRVRRLSLLAEQLVDQDNYALLLGQIQELAPCWEQGRVLIVLGERLVRAGHEAQGWALLEQARLVATALVGERDQSDLRSKLARALIALERYGDAITCAAPITDSHKFQQVIQELMSLQRYDEAIACMEASPSRRAHGNLQRDLVGHLVTLGRMKQARALAERIEIASYRAEALGRLVPTILVSGGLAEAMALAAQIEHPWDEGVLLEVALALASAGELAQALTLARTLKTRAASWSGVLGQIAKAMLQSGRHVEALALARTIEPADVQARELAELAGALVATGQDALALQVATEALALCRQAEGDSWQKSVTLGHVLTVLSRLAALDLLPAVLGELFALDRSSSLRGERLLRPTLMPLTQELSSQGRYAELAVLIAQCWLIPMNTRELFSFYDLADPLLAPFPALGQAYVEGLLWANDFLVSL